MYLSEIIVFIRAFLTSTWYFENIFREPQQFKHFESGSAVRRVPYSTWTIFSNFQKPRFLKIKFRIEVKNSKLTFLSALRFHFLAIQYEYTTCRYILFLWIYMYLYVLIFLINFSSLSQTFLNGISPTQTFLSPGSNLS